MKILAWTLGKDRQGAQPHHAALWLQTSSQTSSRPGLLSFPKLLLVVQMGEHQLDRVTDLNNSLGLDLTNSQVRR